MRRSFKKLFTNKEKLYKMTNLRRIGWAFTSLAGYFNCDRSSIQDQCEKYGIYPEHKIYTLERIATKTISKKEPKERYWEKVGDENICLGKSYKDYLKDGH